MRMKKKFSVALLALMGTGAFAQNPTAPLPMDPALRYGILENGLTYYIRHNDVVPERADFYIVQDVGAILEEDNQNGLAHFLEHIAFNGTTHFPGKSLINYFETVGVKFGANINAYTSLDQTVYNLTSVPTYREGIVDSALLVLHDWSGFISMEPDEIDKERGVIREEWRTRANANRRIWSKSLPILYRNSQYAKRDVIGDTAVINNFAPQTLRDFYNKWYRPDLQGLVIVGDINVDSIEAKLRRIYADVPKRVNPAPRPYFRLEDNAEPIVAIITDPEARQTRIDIEFRHEPQSDRSRASFAGYLATIYQNLISNMLGLRLDEICQKADAPIAGAYAAYGELVRTKDVFELLAIAHDGHEMDALKTLLSEAERVRRFGFTQTEFDRAKIDMLSQMEKGYNERNKTKNNTYVQEYIGNFLRFEPVPGIEWEFQTLQKVLPAISLDHLNNVAKKYIGEQNMTVMISGAEKNAALLPQEKAVLDAIEEVRGLAMEPYKEKDLGGNLVKKMPKKGKIKKEETNTILDAKVWTLSNGMRVVLKPTKLKDDEILLYAYSEGGLSLIDNLNELPSGRLCTDIVENNGLGDFNMIDLNKKLAGKVVSISPSVGGYEESISGSSSVKDVETLLQLFHLYFTSVREDEEGFAALYNQYKTYLTNKVLDPNSAFSDSISVTTNQHNKRSVPFNMDLLNQVDQKKALNLFKGRFANPADFTVYMIGNIDEEQIKPIILTYLGGIKQQGELEKWKDQGSRKPKGIVKNYFEKDLKVDKASNYVLYSGAMDFTLENRIAMGMIADILRMRYTESLREQEGGTYGVSTRGGVSSKPIQEATLQMSFDTDPKLQEKMIALIHSEVDSICKNGPKTSDFQKVKENLTNNYKSNQKENRWWLNTLVAYYKDGDNMTEDYMRVVEGMTPEKIQKTLIQLVDQKNIIEVVMKPKN